MAESIQGMNPGPNAVNSVWAHADWRATVASVCLGREGSLERMEGGQALEGARERERQAEEAFGRCDAR